MNIMWIVNLIKFLLVFIFFGFQGVVLFVVFIILLVVLLIGVLVIKSGIFYECMVFNVQLEEMFFQVVEIGINVVIVEVEVNGGMLNIVFKIGIFLEYCVFCVFGLIEGVCDDVSMIDICVSVNVDVFIEFEGKSFILGMDVVVFMYFEFFMIGDGSYVDINLLFWNRNYQGWCKIGFGNGCFSDDNNLFVDLL